MAGGSRCGEEKGRRVTGMAWEKGLNRGKASEGEPMKVGISRLQGDRKGDWSWYTGAKGGVRPGMGAEGRRRSLSASCFKESFDYEGPIGNKGQASPWCVRCGQKGNSKGGKLSLGQEEG